MSTRNKQAAPMTIDALLWADIDDERREEARRKRLLDEHRERRWREYQAEMAEREARRVAAIVAAYDLENIERGEGPLH